MWFVVLFVGVYGSGMDGWQLLCIVGGINGGGGLVQGDIWYEGYYEKEVFIEFVCGGGYY